MFDLEATDPLLGSGYNTLGRPSSLPVSNKNFPRSSSNPDLNALTPTSPDNEISAILGTTDILSFVKTFSKLPLDVINDMYE